MKYLKNTHPKNIAGEPFPWFPKMIATAFGVGYLPLAPGTWGSIFAIVVWLPLYVWGSWLLTFTVTLCATILYAVVGTWASTEAEKYWGKDPVIACADEVVGQWISLLPLSAGAAFYPWWMVVISLVLFRLFDIFKPLGIRSLERLPGGIGMMADDILAGIYSAAILMAACNFYIGVWSF